MLAEHRVPVIAFVWRPEEIIPPVIQMAHRTGSRAIFDFSMMGAEGLHSFLRKADPAGHVRDVEFAALDGCIFASEIKSLRAAGIRSPTDPEALKLYFLLGYIPEPYSAYQTVRKLEPGSWLLYRADGSVSRGRYWNMPAAGVPRASRLFARGCLSTRPPDLRRSGAAALDCGRAARRVSERRHRLQPGGGLHGAPVARSREDFLDRLRGE